MVLLDRRPRRRPSERPDRAVDAGQVIYVRYRRAASLIARDDNTVAHRPVLEECLAMFRQLGHRIAEAEALGALADVLVEGDLPGAIDITVESARVALADGWRFWAALQLNGAAGGAERSNLDAAEEHSLAALDLNLQLEASPGAWRTRSSSRSSRPSAGRRNGPGACGARPRASRKPGQSG